MMTLSTLHPTQSVHMGDGALERAGTILSSRDARQIFLVVDRAAYTHSGAAERLAPCLTQRETTAFDDFRLNPKIEDIETGVEHARAFQPDAILALGGGSAIDVAKAIAAGMIHEQPIRDLVLGRAAVLQRGPLLVAVPTTAGTGSEATHFAVVYVDGQKYSLAAPSLLPDVVILDPSLTHTLPPSVTAASGLDAVCQAIESIWAVGAGDDSVADATQAARLGLDHLLQAVHRPTPEARAAMLEAAHLAGRAINITKTTAPHAFSYALTARYGVPHGVAVALTLGVFLEYNSRLDAGDCLDPRGPDAVRARLDTIVRLLGAASVEEACRRWSGLLAELQVHARLKDVGIRTADLPALIAAINPERLANNPRRIHRAELLTLLEPLCL
jgi:alcohol dehydrogenase class IV